MKRILLVLTATILAIGLTSSSAFAVSIGLLDTFQNGTTNNWFAGGLGLGQVPPVPPLVIPSGGPAGVGDQFLQITGNGLANQPGSRIVAINGAQWAGNYLASGVAAIEMDLKNFGQTALTIRLLFEDPFGAPPNDQAVTTFGAVLPVGGGWTHFVFLVSPSSVTPIFGNATTALSSATLIRIIDSPTPTDAVTIAGVVGVDNIKAAAVPEASSFLLITTALMSLGGVYRRRSERSK